MNVTPAAAVPARAGGPSVDASVGTVAPNLAAAGSALPAPAPQVDPLAPAIAAARALAAGAQGGLSPLLADLAQALRTPGLPAPLEHAISQVLALRLPGDRPIGAEDLKQAIARSGLFLEARIAQATPHEAPAPDLKAALLNLQAVLTRMAEPRPAASRSPPPPPPPPPPPVLGSALAAQAPARPSFAETATHADIAQRLHDETSQALSRLTLHQLASAPDSPANGPAWLFELPVATPCGDAVTPFEIHRDDEGRGGGEAAGGWTVRFSIDLEPLGPVHVQLRGGPDRMAVDIWAEGEEGLGRLRPESARLAAELDAEVALHRGQPRRAAPEPGRFLDRTS